MIEKRSLKSDLWKAAKQKIFILKAAELKNIIKKQKMPKTYIKKQKAPKNYIIAEKLYLIDGKRKKRILRDEKGWEIGV